MRVLCLGNRYPPHSEGGYELVWLGAVEALRAAGHDVRVLTSDVTGPAPAEAPDPHEEVFRDLRLYWREHAFMPRMPIRERIALERHNGSALDRHLSEFAPAVVTLWGMGALSLGLVERIRRRRVPMVALVSDDWLVYGPGADQWFRAGRRLPGPIRTLVERGTRLPLRIPEGPEVAWLFVSEATRRAAAASGWRLARTEVAPTGIEEHFLGPARHHDWTGRLLYVGRIDPRKGIDTAIRAVAALTDGTTLTVVGDGDAAHRRALESLAAGLGVADRVQMRPGVPHRTLPELYDEHDAVIFCVRWQEPWGLVPLEAMARGRPVIASGRGGSGEYLRHEQNCLIAHPERADEVAAAVRRLAGDPALRARLTGNGARTARAYTAERFEANVVEAVEAEARRA